MGKRKQNNVVYQNKPRANRKYKDRVFRMIFEERKDLLELYNAVNHTSYEDETELVINTLEDAVYIGMKNDLSFLIGGTLNLYEEQSSYNPNMPVRGLMYFARLYEGYVAEQGLNIYGSALQKLPTPQYVVFYNGVREEPDCQVLSLRDAFQDSDTGQEACLDCTALMLNINYSHNLELQKRCRKLGEYSAFVEKVRDCLAKKHDIGSAVDEAIEECIQGNVLKEFLVKHCAEVKGMILTSFDKEKYEEMIRKEEKESERERINKLNQKLFEQERAEDVVKASADREFQDALLKEFGL